MVQIINNQRDSFIAKLKSQFSSSKMFQGNKAFLKNFTEDFLAFLTERDLGYLDSKDFARKIERYWQLCKNRKADSYVIDIYNAEQPSPYGNKKPRYRTSFFLALPDMPFVVGTVFNALRDLGLDLHVMLHATIDCKKSDFSNEGFINCLYIESQRVTDPAQLEMLEVMLQKQLADNNLVVNDFDASQTCMKKIIANYQALLIKDKETVQEIIDFIEWAIDGNFIFMGIQRLTYRDKGGKYAYRVDKDTRLGLLRHSDVKCFAIRSAGEVMPDEFQDFISSKKYINVQKSNYKAIVHRPAFYDVIQIKHFNQAGKLVGEHEIFGLFTSSYYLNPVDEIPILRINAKMAMEALHLEHSPHHSHLFMHMINHYPRDDIWRIPISVLAQELMGIIEAETCINTRLFIRQDPYQRFITVNLYIPTESYSVMFVQNAIAFFQETFNSSLADRNIYFGDSKLANIQFTFHTTQKQIPKYSVKKLEEEIITLSQPWDSKLSEKLHETYNDDVYDNIHMTYCTAFPINYRDTVSMERTIADIELIEAAIGDSDHLAIEVYQEQIIEKSGPVAQWHLRMAQTDRDILLSDILPKLESVGLKILAEDHFIISPLGANEIAIHDFIISFDGTNGNVTEKVQDEVISRFLQTFREVWGGRFATDNFNSLSLKAHLDYHSVILFRIISAYFRQGKMPFTASRICECLHEYPEITRQLVKYFESRFHPETALHSEEKKLKVQILASLEKVRTLDEDRIFRAHFNFITCLLRTNFYQKTRDETNRIISFKIASQQLDFLPEPRPFREIFVFSERFEAVHLRFGKVARGGLRWSDRKDDFRTEILGLVKAQQVKNSVIVPVGSKGGFVLKRAQPDRESFMKEGIACYKLFIQAMLDNTDNLVNNKIIKPKNVLAKDDDDPYLVVAADKGTATFSDIANEIAINHNFWLGDAFASGGSAGYDHKKMGITARGAWECVKRHFREMDIDIQSTPFSVVGIGDMSGDVFGNGMLLSKQICLRAAFNHLHIFVDPNPDPAKSFTERKRLFNLTRIKLGQIINLRLSQKAARFLNGQRKA